MGGDEQLLLSPAADLAALVRSRRISCRELLDLHLARIAALDPPLNAVVTLDADGATAAAGAADELTVSGRPLGPLHGLPVTVKDAIEVGGLVSTGGAAELARHVPARDAPVVARVRAAGAVIMGKTNVPRWSGDIQTYNDVFGTTSNPWDTGRTPGGSSGGPAVAVATGMSAFEIGTDIGGSIRIPASFCGVYGHKPTFGVVPQKGYLDSVGGGTIDADINVFGPLARTPGDLELVLDVIAGPEIDAARAWRLDLPPPRHRDVSAYRIGVWADDPHCPVESGAAELIRAAGRALEEAGAAVDDARPPLDLAEMEALFTDLLLPAISVSLDRDLADALSGTHRKWLDRHRRRTAVRRVWADWFSDFDALLCPVVPMLPFPHDHTGAFADRSVTVNGAVRSMVGTLAWTGLVGVAHLPSTVVPVGTVDGLPVGMQIVGPYLEDRTPLFLAERVQDLVGGFVAPPGCFDARRGRQEAPEAT